MRVSEKERERECVREWRERMHERMMNERKWVQTDE